MILKCEKGFLVRAGLIHSFKDNQAAGEVTACF